MPDFPPFPLHYGSVAGQYRATWRAAIVATQAAGSRLFTVRNKHATYMHVPLQLNVKVLQTGAFTAAIEDSFDAYKLTAFSVSDTVNQVAVPASKKITTLPVSNAEIVGVTAAGAAAGMTGGTLTPDAGPLGSLPAWFLAALPTTQLADVRVDPFIEMGQNAGPFILAQNEGLAIVNRVLLGAAAGASIYIDYSWAELEEQ